MITSGILYLKETGKKRGTGMLTFLLVVFCLFISNSAFSQVTLSLGADQNPLNCNGGTTNITATAGGGTEPYQYSINNNTNWQPGNTFGPLGAGTYTIYVKDALDVEGSGNLTLTEPAAPLSFSVSGSSFTCEGAGTITVSVAEGTPDYTVAVSGPTSSSLSGPGSVFNFSGLDGGNYTVSVSDAKGCSAGSQPHMVTIDVSAPTVTSLPVPEGTDFASITSGNLSNVTINGPLSFNYTSSGNNDIGTLNFFYYSNASYSFTVNCTGTPSSSDIIRVLESFDNGNNFTPLSTRNGFSSGLISGPINLNIDPTSNREVIIRIEVVIATSGLVYDISNLLIKADERVHTGSYSSSGPSYTDLNGATSTFSDGEVYWFCSTTGSEELTFTRDWSATDNCGNTSPNTSQLIRVGIAPTFGPLPASVTYDFCHNLGVSIAAPTVSDNCTATANLVLEWIVLDSDGNSVSGWNSYPSASTFDFAPVPEGQEFLIGWRVTDEAGFSTVIDASTTTQRIIFKPAITISLLTSVSPANYDVCEGSNPTFHIHGIGGTGGYQINSISPSPTQTLPISFSNGADATFTYNATNQIAAGSSITITYQDIDFGIPTVIGGCPAAGSVTFSSGGGVFTIHQKISTGAISRD